MHVLYARPGNPPFSLSKPLFSHAPFLFLLQLVLLTPAQSNHICAFTKTSKYKFFKMLSFLPIKCLWPINNEALNGPITQKLTFRHQLLTLLSFQTHITFILGEVILVICSTDNFMGMLPPALEHYYHSGLSEGDRTLPLLEVAIRLDIYRGRRHLQLPLHSSG